MALVRACCAGPLGSLLVFWMKAPRARLRFVFPVSKNSCASVAAVFVPPRVRGLWDRPAVHLTPSSRKASTLRSAEPGCSLSPPHLTFSCPSISSTYLCIR